MKIQKFKAQTMNEALHMVSSTLGKDAVILQSRKVSEGGVLGIGEKSLVEVTAAVDTSAGNLPILPAAKPAPPQADRSSRKDIQKEELRLAALTQQVKGLEESVKVMSHRLQYPAVPALPEPLGNYYVTLIESGMQPETVSKALMAVYESIDGKLLSNKVLLENSIRSAIASLVPKLKDKTDAEGEPLRIALVGPTGVGKTTTIAKMAANAKLFKKLNAALITADTFRIAAAEQLKSFAEILKMPMEVVYSQGEMRKAVDIHSDKDIIFIDTTGRSPRDTENVEELMGLVQAAKPHVVHLVLSAVTEPGAQALAVRKFGKARIDSLIFTKLDETSRSGAIIDNASVVRKPIAYTTDGQNVPDDISKWNAMKFAGSLIGSD